MRRKSLTAALALSMLLLTSCGSRQLLASGGDTADVEPPQMEQSETADQKEPTGQTEQTEAADQTEPTEPTSPVAVSDYSSAEALRRSEHAWLNYYGVGSMTAPAKRLKSEAALFIGDGYSIYILDDEWIYQADTMGGRHTDIWKNVSDENAEMRIVKMDGNSLSAAQDWVREQYPEYVLVEDMEGGLHNDSGSSGSIFLQVSFHLIGEELDASFRLAGEDLYAVIIKVPAAPVEYFDRFWDPISAMARTFRPFFYFPTAEELGRPEHMQLSCRAGGEETVSEASIYVGNSYSIYLTDGEWTPQTGIMESCTVGAWRSTLNDGVELRVESGRNYTEYLRRNNPGYVFTEGENGGVTGVNAEGWRMEVSYRTFRTDKYTIYKVYPPADMEESEHFKSLLDAMVDTFEPFKNAVQYY